MRCVLALLVLAGCGGDPWRPVSREPNRTEVIFIGTLHRVHMSDEDYPMRLVESLLRASQPDVVVAEIPPAALERVMQAHRDERDDPWLTSFPELSAVVLPLQEELDFVLVPGSGWSRQVTDDWTTYWSAHPSGPDAELFQRVWGHVAERLEERGSDPGWIASPMYRSLTAWADTSLSTHAGEALGRADPIEHYRAHANLLKEAIETHQGRRIAVIFDARRRWYLEQAVGELAGVVVHDTRALLDGLD